MNELTKAKDGAHFEPGMWLKAEYQDTPPRFIYRCPDCGKVNALSPEKHTVGVDGVVTATEEGQSAAVECEGKACKFEGELKLVA